MTNSGWTSVRIVPSSPGARERCIASLFGVGAQGVHEDGSALVTHFPPDTSLDDVAKAIRTADSDAVIETAAVDDVDWSEAWKTRIVAQKAGEITIVPPWLAADRDAGRTVVIDPGMAFGTGDHATTRGVVRLMPSVLRRGNIVADLGAGSAVLSIAAAKLGASRVYAIELDGEAIPDAVANVERNEVSDTVHVFEGDAATILPLVAPVHVVLANIISSVLIEILPVIGRSLVPDDAAILSGILLEERAIMLEILSNNGWRVMLEDQEEIWWSVSIAQA